jgi:pyruvate/2-oxoglutarate dehydrogenase complex dihydrolipoamide dehydrogenase (E3) component
MHTYDAIVIGTGQAGPSLARRLGGAGRKVAIIERGRFGGTCINTGCTPTKAMVASAYAAHVARRGAEYGVTIPGPVGVDMRRVKARKDAISGTSRDAVERSLRNATNVTVYQGHARFVAPHEVSIGDMHLTAEQIFINVGGRPSIHAIPGLDTVQYLTSSSILDLDCVPPHLVVVGGSYVGLEFGQVFRRFGAEVTVIEAGQRLLSREDPEISDAVRDILAAEDIAIHLGAQHLRLEPADHGVTARFAIAGEQRATTGSHLLLATGRRPNTDDLGLDRAGVAVESAGYIQVDDTLRTNIPGIWALGECNGHGAFTHTAYNDAEIVAANLLAGENRGLHDRITAYALFIDPPLGRAGMTETEARAAGHPVLVGSMLMEDVSRAYEKGETLGLMKIVVHRDSKQILGATILGTGGDEAVHCVLDLMYAKAPYPVLQRAMHIHPTVAEFIPSLLEDLAPAV